MEAPREISTDSQGQPLYSFCTLVTKPLEYLEMVEAFQAKGFDDDTEYLYIDNSHANHFDGFSGYNRFLRMAQGKYIVLLHQDLLPIADDRSKLDRILAELTTLDPTWGICGNAGALLANQVSYSLTDPLLPKEREGGPFPVKAMSLDENFMIVRAEANLAASRDLSGFHWYAADLCLISDVLGWSVYVVDFHLRHKSGGFQDPSYRRIRTELIRKYGRAFSARWLYTIGTQTFIPALITGSPRRFLDSLTFGASWTIFVSLVSRVIKRRSLRVLSQLKAISR